MLPSLYSSYKSSDIVAFNSFGNQGVFNLPANQSSPITGALDTTRSVALNSDLSALSIRATEYLQRWKEVVQFSSKDYSDQMAAQFGIKAPEYMGNHCHYIGG